MLPLNDWSIPPPPAEPPPFAAARGFTPAVWPLVAARFPEAAADEEALRRLVSPRLADLSNPFAFPGVREAAAALSSAIDAGGEIVVFGDFDADGVVATSILVSTIRSLGGRVRPFIPFRSEGYGLSDAAVTRCLADGVPSLLITVDCGITADEALGRFLGLGAKVVVTDHHLPGGTVLPPDCIVAAPHLPDVPPHLRDLSGAGVAFEVAAGLVLSRLPDKDAAGLAARRRLFARLDALALATVADVVPLVGENRTLVSLGLQRLNDRPTTGLRQLLLATMDDAHVDARDLGFTLGPHINSAGRMADATLSLDLLLAEDDDAARALAIRLKQTNALRKSECTRVDSAAAEQAASPDIFDPEKDGAFVGAADDWHPGVVGLGAAHVADRFQRPAALVSFLGGTVGRGSVRAPAGYDVHAALAECARWLVSFGGHESAAGLSIARENLAPFRKAFSEACMRQTGALSVTPALDFAGTLTLADVGLPLYSAVTSLEPFGEGNPEPVFLVENVAVSASILGKTVAKGLRLAIEDASGVKMEGLWFGGQEHFAEFREHARWDLAAALLPDDYSGANSVKLRIIDARPR